MTRLCVFAEGQTERAFVSEVLSELLCPRGIFPFPVLLGGHTIYQRVRMQVIRQPKQDKQAYCTTMIDFYGLGKGYPGAAGYSAIPASLMVETIEKAILEDVCKSFPNLRADVRFIPYLSLHEFEALLFSDPDAFAKAIGQPGLTPRLQAIRKDYDTPEDIDNSTENAPSKRVLRLHPGYGKVIDGTTAAKAVGAAKMREQCPHFRSWLQRLEKLAELASPATG